MQKRQVGIFREKSPRFWMSIGGVVVLHVILILVMSPDWSGRADMSPEGLYARAHRLVEEGQYAEAVEQYDLLLAQKPEVFRKAENEIGQARERQREAERRAAREAARQADTAAKAAAEAASTEDDEHAGESDGSASGRAATTDPAIDLPAFPMLGEDF